MDDPTVLIAAALALLGCAGGICLAIGALYSWSLPDLNPPPARWEE
jgi:hypothetical protein